jgi:hypothetical protein
MMGKWRSVFAALCVAMLSAGGLVAPASAQTQADAFSPTRLALGRELAELLNNEAMTRVQIDKMLTKTLPDAFRSDPEVRALEKRYPGVIEVMLDTMAPMFVDRTLSMLPEMWDALAPIYAEELTEDELRAALAFFRSPTGAKVLMLMGEEMDFSAALTETQRGDGRISETGLMQGSVAGVTGTLRRLSPEEAAEVRAFSLTPAGRGLARTLPRVQAVAMEFANTEDPEFEAAIQAALIPAVEAHTGLTLH